MSSRRSTTRCGDWRRRSIRRSGRGGFATRPDAPGARASRPPGAPGYSRSRSGRDGRAPYLIALVRRGVTTAVAMNGSAAIHDFELGFAGKTSEDVGAQLPAGNFGMARETADAFAVAAQRGSQNDRGLGSALGQYM